MSIITFSVNLFETRTIWYHFNFCSVTKCHKFKSWNPTLVIQGKAQKIRDGSEPSRPCMTGVL